MMLEATLSEHYTVLESGDGVPTCHDVRRHPEHSTVLESGNGFPGALRLDGVCCKVDFT